MAINITFEIEGEKQVAGTLTDIGGKLDNVDEPLKNIRKYLLKTWQRNFQSAGKLLGKPWKKLKPETVRRKGGRGGILRDSGTMVRSFVGEVRNDTLTMSNTTDYFKYHQSRKPRTSNLPRRIMMRINEYARQRIFEFFNEFVNKQIPRDYKKK